MSRTKTEKESADALPKARLGEMLGLMYRIRRFERRARELYLDGHIRGALHLYIGEEAVAVGVCTALEKDDYIVSTHRGHGHCIAKGGELRYMMAELLGKETGYCRGRGGSMHIFDPGIGNLGANGIVGAGLPIAAGAAFSALYRDSGQVAVCFFGDGAANQGTFHEALNLSALWRLPVVFVCENNLYAHSTSVSESLPLPDVSVRAGAYGIHGTTVDGCDVRAVFRVVRDAVSRARHGGGPALVECKTYRHESHCMAAIDLRPKEEVERWKEKDPVRRFESELLASRTLTEEERSGLAAEADAAVEDAVDFALESKFPEGDGFMEGLYASN